MNRSPITTSDHVILQVYHTGGTDMGRGGFGTLTPTQIYDTMQERYGVPGVQEEGDVLGQPDIPIN